MLGKTSGLWDCDNDCTVEVFLLYLSAAPVTVDSRYEKPLEG